MQRLQRWGVRCCGVRKPGARLHSRPGERQSICSDNIMNDRNALHTCDWRTGRALSLCVNSGRMQKHTLESSASATPVGEGPVCWTNHLVGCPSPAQCATLVLAISLARFVVSSASIAVGRRSQGGRQRQQTGNSPRFIGSKRLSSACSLPGKLSSLRPFSYAARSLPTTPRGSSCTL